MNRKLRKTLMGLCLTSCIGSCGKALFTADYSERQYKAGEINYETLRQDRPRKIAQHIFMGGVSFISFMYLLHEDKIRRVYNKEERK